VGNPNDGPKTAEQFFNTSAFVRPPIYEFGNASPNITNADRILSLDFTLHKAFKITERHATPSATSMPAILAASTASGSLRGRFSSVCAIASKPTRFVQRKGRGSPRPFLVMRPSTGCHRLPRGGFSLTLQRDIGYKTVLDVGYMGSLGRHLLWQPNLNAIPFGSNFLAPTNDPTTNRPLPLNFLRPYPAGAI